MKKISVAITMIIIIAVAKAQPAPEKFIFDNLYTIFDSDIHTLQISREGSNDNFPIVELNSGEKIECSFDDFDITGKDYAYTFYHCTPEWENTQTLQQSEYMSGYYYEDYIRDYESSFNTLRDYTHYSFTFPNESIAFSRAGNYALVVYEESIEEPTFIARFYVYESLVDIVATVGFSKNPQYLASKQKVDFSINCSSYPVFDPYNNLKVFVWQNHRPYSVQGSIQPKYVSADKIFYNYDNSFEFNGNNEFRDADLTSVKQITRSVYDIQVEYSQYHITLYPEEPFAGKQYKLRDDINGDYVVAVRDVNDAGTEGEYVLTYFTLRTGAPFQGQDAYICGDFNGWHFDEGNKMTYNYEKGRYEGTLYIKQGYLDYTYILKRGNTGEIDETYFDGSFAETRNTYIVFAYYKYPGENYYGIIGVSSALSKR